MVLYAIFQVRPSPEKVCKVAVACCILHNIAIDFNMPEPDEAMPEPVVDDGVEGGAAGGMATRDHIVNHFFVH